MSRSTVKANPKQPTDFNDLHMMFGLEVVKNQILEAIHDAQQTSADVCEFDEQAAHSPHPSEKAGPVAKFEIETLLKRFAYAMPDGKVWDSHKKVLIKKTAFKDMVTKALFEEWLDHDTRRTVDQNSVLQEAEDAKANLAWGALGIALDRYVYLYPSTDVWDKKKKKVIPANALKLAIADCYDDWSKHPNREEIDIENLVFDPTQSVDPATHINLFVGLPIAPVENDFKCVAIRELLLFLCNRNPDVYMWLISWLAYPLQNVGGKLATAVLMHSEVQGSGKSLFFDGIMRKIYGAEYSSTLGQHQLESPYTDWRSKMLYGVFEEIFSRDQKYSHTGTMKQMITSPTQRIEKKFMSGWEEANHMNAVFLSNEIQPFPVEPFDRRMLVIWPEGKLEENLINQVIEEMHGGGIEAFYYHLLSLDLQSFGSHTEPPMTEAKERLIDFGRAGWDSFYQEWSKGYLKVPFSSCLIVDLYEAYKNWCHSGHERQVSLKKFSDFMSVPSRGKRKRDVWYQVALSKKKGTFLIVDTAPEDMPQSTWLGRCVSEFQKELKECSN